MNIAKIKSIMNSIRKSYEIMINEIAVSKHLITKDIVGIEHHWIMEFNYDDYIKERFVTYKITELNLSNAEINFNTITTETVEGDIITISLFGLSPLVVETQNENNWFDEIVKVEKIDKVKAKNNTESYAERAERALNKKNNVCVSFNKKLQNLEDSEEPESNWV